jgi:phosphatidylglycerophosphatase A
VSLLDAVSGSLFVVAFACFAIWVSSGAESLFQEKDSSRIVIDEMAGFLVTLFLIPWSATSVVVGFLSFRAFDILKPFPARRLESRLRGGWGVVLDDLFAGLYANVVTRLILGFFVA